MHEAAWQAWLQLQSAGLLQAGAAWEAQAKPGRAAAQATVLHSSHERPAEGLKILIPDSSCYLDSAVMCSGPSGTHLIPEESMNC